ncbi:MAG: ATP-grasp domain-containing protein [Lysobacter sp.]
MSRLALVTAISTAAQDDDLPLLHAACLARGLPTEIRAWDDPSVAWSRYDAVLLRSPWDYTERFGEFSDWCERVDALTRLLNPWPVLRWNTDKHYLADLAARGVPVVPTAFVEPDMDPLPALQEFLLAYAEAEEFVVKPTISAGSRDTQRYNRAQEFAAANHIARLLDEGRSAMLQPYLASVDRDGETALMHFNGVFSHAIRKGAMLQREDALNLRAVERINAREAAEDELTVALHALSATTARLDLEEPLPYARVDLIRDGEGRPQLLELELCEPSLFFAHAEGSAEAFAEVLAQLLATSAAP